MIGIQVCQHNGQKVAISMEGTDAEIAIVLAHAMQHNVDLASIVCASIPIFLDRAGKSRKEYCELVMKSKWR